MSTFKKIALTLLAAALPCFAWGETTWTWTDVATSLPTSRLATMVGNMDAVSPGSPVGAINILNRYITCERGTVTAGWNGTAQTATGSAEGGEGYWSGASITLFGRSGVGGMAAVIVPTPNIPDGTEIKKLRVTATIRGTYKNEADETVNTASGSCAIAIGHATYNVETSVYSYIATSAVQGIGGDGTDTQVVATIDYPCADVITWDESSENADKILLSVSTPQAAPSNVYIVQIDKVEYLTLENYKAANMPVPNAVQLIDFGGTTDATATGWTVQTAQTAGGQIVLDGFSVTKASGAGNFYSSNVITTDVVDFQSGTYAGLNGVSHETVLAEMAATLGLQADAINANVYTDGLGNGGFTGHTATISNLDPSRTYVFYYIGGGVHGSGKDRDWTAFQLATYAGTPTVASVRSDAATYSIAETPTTAIQNTAKHYLLVRVSNVKPTAEGTITFTLTNNYAGINAFAIAEMDRVLNDTAETWVNTAKWTTPTATSNPILTVNNNVTLTAGEAATAGTLTINNAVGKDYKLTFAGESLTTTTLNVNANTDVSDITANLGTVTVAEGKTLTLGPVATSTVTSVTGNGNLVLGSGVWDNSKLSHSGKLKISEGTSIKSTLNNGVVASIAPTTIEIVPGTGDAVNKTVEIYNSSVTNGNKPFTFAQGTALSGSGDLVLAGTAGGGTLNFDLTTLEPSSTFVGNLYFANVYAQGCWATLTGTALDDVVINTRSKYDTDISGSIVSGTSISITSDYGKHYIQLAGDTALAGVNGTNTSETIVTSESKTTRTLTLNVAEGKSHSFAGTFGDSTTPLSLVKAGDGTQTFGTAYLNNLTMTEGTLALGSSTIGSLAGEGGTLTLNSATSIGALGGTTTYSGAITGSGALTLTGGTLTLKGANTRTGNVTVASGATLDVSGQNARLFQANSGDYSVLTVYGTLKTREWSWGADTAFGKLRHNPGNLVIDGGKIVFASDCKSERCFTIRENGATFEVSANVTYTLNNSTEVNLSGTGKLTKTGAGTFVINDTLPAISGFDINGGIVNITVAQTYTGGTTVANGATLSGTGSLSGALTLADGAILDATAGALTVNGAVTQSGALTIKVASATDDLQVLTCAASTFNTETISLVNAEGATIEGFVVEANDAGTALVLAAVPVVSAGTPLAVDAIPSKIVLDTNSFGYGTHTVVTLSSTVETSAWSGMTVTGLPAGVTKEDIVVTETTWGFKVNTLVIYPIGDSITHGRVCRGEANSKYNDTDVPGGYRLPLYRRLTDAGFTIKYVGDRKHNNATEPVASTIFNSPTLEAAGQDWHSGHSAWRVNGVHDKVADWASTVRNCADGRDPDVILLLLGVNDLSGDREEPTATAEQMKALIWRLAGIGDKPAGETLEAALYPNARIVLAKVLDSTYPRTKLESGAVLSEHIGEYNTLLADYVTSLTDDQGAGRISIIDLKTPADDVHMRYDYLHPAEEGYEQMARNWFAELDRIYDPLVVPAMTAVSRKNTEIELFLPVTATDAASDAASYVLTNEAVEITNVAIANDKRTVTLTVSGFDVGAETEIIYAPDDSLVGHTTVTAGPALNPTAEIEGLHLLAEWSGFATGVLPTAEGLEAQRGASVETGRPWLLKAMSSSVDNAALTVEDGVLNLNGVALQIVRNDESAFLAYGRPALTVVMEVEGDATGDGLLVARYNNGTTDDDVLVRYVRSANGITAYTHVDTPVLLNGTVNDGVNAYAFSTPHGAAARTLINDDYITTESITYGPDGNWEFVDFIIGATDYAATPAGADYKIRSISIYEGDIDDSVNITDTVWKGEANADWAIASNWTKGVPSETLDAIIPAGASITLNADATAKSITISAVEGQNTASISGAFTLKVTEGITIAANQTLKTTNTKLAAPVSGAGTLHIVGTKYSGHNTSAVLVDVPCPIENLTDATLWTGTVIFDTISGVRNLNLADFGNESSKITLEDVEGDWDHALNGNSNTASNWTPISIPADLCIKGENTLDNGYAMQRYVLSGAITGSGSLNFNVGATVSGSGVFSFTGDISDFKGKITDVSGKAILAIGQTVNYNANLQGSCQIYGEQELNCTITLATSTNDNKVIRIHNAATVSGNGTFGSKVVFDAGATLDATAGSLKASADVVFPETGALDVIVNAFPTADAPVTLIARAGLTPNQVMKCLGLSMTDGETTVSSGYHVVTTDAGYALAVRPTVEKSYSVASVADITAALAEITAVEDSDVAAVATLNLSGPLTLNETLVIDIGDLNSLTLDLKGNAIRSAADPVIWVKSGQVEVVTTAPEATGESANLIAATGTNVAIRADGSDSGMKPTVMVDSGVKVTAGEDAVSVDYGATFGGLGTITGGILLGNGATLDASDGPITLNGELTFPAVTDFSPFVLLNVILPEDTTGYPARFITCAGATEEVAESVSVSVTVGSRSYFNDKVCLMLNNADGSVNGYGVMQYTWVDADSNMYMTFEEALAAGKTEVSLFKDTRENIVVPSGVIVRLGYTDRHTLAGNVTVKSGATLTPMGGTINGNLILESGATLNEEVEFEYPDSYTFTVTGDVTFPTGEDTTLTVRTGSSAATVDLGVPRQIIASGTPLTPGTVASIDTLNVVLDNQNNTNPNTKIIATSYTYELVSTETGPCTFDGIDYASIEQALRAYAKAPGNRTIKLNLLEGESNDYSELGLTQTLVIDVDDPDTEALEGVTIDLAGCPIDATLANEAPTIRVESGKLTLISSAAAQISSTNGTAIVVGANADGEATTKAALCVESPVVLTAPYASAAEVVSGTIGGTGTLMGTLTLQNGAILDASKGTLTMGELTYGTFSMPYGITFPAEGAITILPPADAIYTDAEQVIACAAATPEAIANTDVTILLSDGTPIPADTTQEALYGFRFIAEIYSSSGETTTYSGYSLTVGATAMTNFNEEVHYYSEFASAVEAAEDLSTEDEDGYITLLKNVTLKSTDTDDHTITANLYTSNFSITASSEVVIEGSLIFGDKATVPSGTKITATDVRILGDATVTVAGTLVSTKPIAVDGTLAGTGKITGGLVLADGSAVTGTFAPTAGTVVEEGATVTVSGSLTGNLTVKNATINGTGTITIGSGNTLTGAGTIQPTVTLTSGATIDKTGYESTPIQLPNLKAFDTENPPMITVTAGTLSHVLTTKTDVTDATYKLVTPEGSAYEAYSAQTTSGDNVATAVAVKKADGTYAVGVVKVNFVLGGVELQSEVARQLAWYAYRERAILAVKGVYSGSDDPQGFACFTNTVAGFTSGDYVIINYDFGVTGITVMDGTVGEGDKAVTTRYVVVTAEVDGPYDGEEDSTGHAGFRSGTAVEVSIVDEAGKTVMEPSVSEETGEIVLDETGAITYTDTAVKATEVETLDEAKALGLVDADAETLPAGVKYFIVPFDDLFPGELSASSETLKFSVKATNE